MKYDVAELQMVSVSFESALRQHVRELSGGELDLATLGDTLRAFESGKLKVAVIATGVWLFNPVRGAEVFTQKRKNKKLLSMVAAGAKLLDDALVEMSASEKALGAPLAMTQGADVAFAEKIRAALADYIVTQKGAMQ